MPQRIRHKDPQAAADRDHLNDHAIQSAAYHNDTASQSPCYMQDKLSLYSMMPRPSGSQPQSFVKPNMAHTWFKSLGEASTDVHATIPVNVIQMLSSEEC